MNIEILEKYKKIVADEGMVITNWDEKDVLDYTSFKMGFVQLTTNVDEYREITEEEDKRLLKEQEEKIKTLQ